MIKKKERVRLKKIRKKFKIVSGEHLFFHDSQKKLISDQLIGAVTSAINLPLLGSNKIYMHPHTHIQKHITYSNALIH